MKSEFWVNRDFEKENIIELKKKRLFELKENVNVMQIYDSFIDLELDFIYLRELNKQISMRYNEMFELFPTSEELNVIIEAVEKGKIKYDNLEKKDKLEKLKKFKSALISLEMSEQLKRPPKYEDLESDK